MRLPIALLTALPLLVASCGGSSDPVALTDTAYQELGSGQYADAATHFTEALAGMDPAHAQFMRAKMGQIEALAHTLPAKSKTEFLSLASSQPDAINDRHYNQVGGWLGDAKAYGEATEVLQAGLKAYPESEQLTGLLETLGDKAAASGDADALEALKGLGYVGD